MSRATSDEPTISAADALENHRWAVTFMFGGKRCCYETYRTKNAAIIVCEKLNKRPNASPGGTPYEVARIALGKAG